MKEFNNHLTLTNDALFKEFFSHKGNEKFLKSFLEELLKLEITSLEISKDAHISIDNILDKSCILDIKAIVNGNIVINLEMQNSNYSYNLNRFSTYGSKLLNSNISKGQTYDMLNPTIAIWILNYELFDFEDYITEAILVPKNHREIEIPIFPKYYFIELNKFSKNNIKEENTLNDWLTFIDGKNKKEVEKIMSRNTTIDEAVRQLEELLANKEVRRIAEAREKNIMDEQSLRKLALTQGLEQGLEKGLKEGLKEGLEKGHKEGLEQGLKQGHEEGCKKGHLEERNLIIKKMLSNGLDTQSISELTSASIEDIEKIKNKL